MGAASGESKPRKSMRVATIFTGVAAATFGMAQAANAQDATHPAAKNTSKHIGQTIRPAGRVSGSIRYATNCYHQSRSHPNWLHTSTWFLLPDTGGDLEVNSVCFGYAGIYMSPPGTGIRAECGGTNKGYLDGSKNDTFLSTRFGPGTTYRTLDWSHLDDVVIDSWTGTNQCGGAPDWGLGGP
jgi:hypothetical protein